MSQKLDNKKHIIGKQADLKNRFVFFVTSLSENFVGKKDIVVKV
jgi:hypothetical protein